ncbi:uncharacterized protein LOC111067662 [Drosophila obscura]|uniref:uncharacterized protein LOC111067662 n=1 Tax=Drosophila obscura TaxID=7282 RepID=UPI001BB214F1|nr:uncharacterized protein LOC111067662 [Drosophila obscura]XP_041449511.1 uncharacterized protein LOC111067662 [Drosophila obscura]
MKIPIVLVLASVLCFFTTKSLADEVQISSANMSTSGIARQIINASSLKCILWWMSRLAKDSTNLNFALVHCAKEYGERTFRILEIFKELVEISKPIVATCSGIIVDIVVGGSSCMKKVETSSIGLVTKLRAMHNETNRKPKTQTRCARDAFHNYFRASSIYRILDGCMNPHKRKTTKNTTIKKTTKKETTIKETTNKETTNEETTNKETTNKETTNEETTNKETTNEETTNKETTNKETTIKETTNEETTNKETTNEETTNKETTNKETTNKETTNEETTNKETTNEETTNEGTTTEPAEISKPPE